MKIVKHKGKDKIYISIADGRIIRILTTYPNFDVEILDWDKVKKNDFLQYRRQYEHLMDTLFWIY